MSPAALLLALALAAPGAAAPEPVAPETIKLATLVPSGSVWDKAFHEMAVEVERETSGRVRTRIYGGGVAGDEADVLRKMRIGQLNAASLTASGLGQIDDAFFVFELPMFFESFEELYAVLQEIRPRLEERAEKKGYVLLNWGHVGWLHLFANAPIRSVGDLKDLKMFVWGGRNRMAQWWKENGFQPVPLAATDILSGLQTGLIDVVPSTPITANSLQWFRSAPYMMDTALMPYLGGTVVTKRLWNSLSEEDRKALKEAGMRVERLLFEEVPKHEAEAIAAMESRGLEVVVTDDDETLADFRELASSFAAHMREVVVPAEILDAAQKARDAYRAAH